MKHSDIEISRELETRTLPVYVPDMSTTIGRLKHLRHVVEGVPDKAFDMAHVVYKSDCGTIGCMIGHAALDDHFNAIGLRPHFTTPGHASSLDVNGKFARGYSTAGADIFGITILQSADLFTSFSHGREPIRLTKAHGIARIDRLIAELGGDA